MANLGSQAGAAVTRVPGQGAIRIGKWKLLHGHTCVWGQRNPTYGCGSCAARDGNSHNGIPLPVSESTSPPFCPNGWAPPPESNKPLQPPPNTVPPCTGIPCEFNQSSFVTGGTFLFDLEVRRSALAH